MFKALKKTGKLGSDTFHKGKAAADAEDRVIYDSKTGALYYDPDGVGGASQIKFAVLSKKPEARPSRLRRDLSGALTRRRPARGSRRRRRTRRRGGRSWNPPGLCVEDASHARPPGCVRRRTGPGAGPSRLPPGSSSDGGQRRFARRSGRGWRRTRSARHRPTRNPHPEEQPQAASRRVSSARWRRPRASRRRCAPPQHEGCGVAARHCHSGAAQRRPEPIAATMQKGLRRLSRLS